MLASLDPKSWRILAVCALLAVFLLRSQIVSFRKPNFYNSASTDDPPTNDTLPDLGRPDFPRRIWQTTKDNAASLDQTDLKAINTWLKLNPKHRFELMTRYSSETYVKDKFPDRPDIVETYLDLQDTVLRSDFIRYLVLLGDGGAYGDIDTECHVPIEDWIPSEYKGQVNMVVGIEYDVRDDGRWADWTRDLQFAAWAVLVQPNHPALQISVDKAIESLRSLAVLQESTLSALKPSYREVLNATGPAMFTDSIFEYLAKATETDFTWHNLTRLEAPRLVADVLILPINGFGAGQAHSGSGPTDGEDVLVTHLFKGSWKADHPLGDERDYEAEKKEKEEAEQAQSEHHSQQEDQSSSNEQKPGRRKRR